MIQKIVHVYANEFIFLNNNTNDMLRDINHNNTQFTTDTLFYCL